jgi:phosphoesterase RecJ-like protein
MGEVVDYISKSKSVLILSHKNPDGDALGSSLGLALALRSLGKKADCFSVGVISDIFDFLPGIKIFYEKVESAHYDLVVLLDCATFARVGIGNIKGIIPSFDRLLIIDHHPKNEVENCENTFSWINEKKSSTSLMIYELLRDMDFIINKDIATCLLTGIFTDTGGFQHSNTDAESLNAAAELMKKGPRIDKISYHMFSNKSIPAIKLWGKALSRIKTDPKTGMAVSYINMEDIEDAGAKKEDLDGLISVINTVSDADFSLLLTELDGQRIKGSLRSEDYKGVDVSRIAKSLGGGGHKLASGFEMEGNMENNINKISELVLALRDKAQQEHKK